MIFGGFIVRKTLSFIIAAVMAVSCLCACSPAANEAGNGKIQIVTTIFPEYDWVMNVLGDNPAEAEVTMLLDNGVDLHSYQPTAADILKISTCDMFIYVGGESDEWVEDALQEATNKDMVVINLLDVLGDSVKEEEVVEGMQEEDEHDHEEEEGETEYDEHVWLSLRNAAILVQNISDSVQSIDPANAETYRNNTASYVEKLNSLDEEYSAAVDNASCKTLLFGDRFPFRYLTDDYGLDYYAAFVGCSAETEASFETITFLSQKVDELGLHAVMTIEGTDHRIADTIVQNTQTKDQQILTLDSMQSTTSRDVQNGITYLSIMEGNLSVLTDALN
ncbi:MAG: metal ABC transporter substrate-binding protein [Saccharofermentans sp.]|nr:metal ABC transporter substrate-binding protein [Saccharofermentans sp.]